MIGKIKMMAIITFYVAVLLVIAVYLQDGSGTFSHFFENANLYIRNLRNVHAPAFHQTYDNYLQLFPLILLFGLKLGGIRGNFGWKRLFTFIVLSVVLTQLVVNGLKLTTGVLRPDATNYFSFPSGHTANAFLGAHMAYKEFKDSSPVLAYSGYALALFVAGSRLYNNRHWVADVVAGAGFGILSVELAYLTYFPIRNAIARKINRKAAQNMVIAPTFNEQGGGVYFSYSF